MKMNRICSVVTELLPLYTDGLLNDSATEFVDEHLSECEVCRGELEHIRQNMAIPIAGDETSAFKKMKKSRAAMMTALCVLAVISIVALSIAGYTWKELAPAERLYMGDRITLTVMAKADGEPVELTAKDVSCLYTCEGGQEQPLHFNRVSAIQQEYSIRGDGYGPYEFIIHFDGEEIRVELWHSNWYNVKHVNFIYEINTENHTMSYILYDESGTVAAEPDGKTYTVGCMI